MLPSVPAGRDPSGLGFVTDTAARSPDTNPGWLPAILGVLRLHPWLILGCVVAVLAVAILVSVRAVPIYEAAAILRIDDKQSTLPELVRLVGPVAELTTELEELRSRSLAGAVARRLSLQLRLNYPRRVRRDALIGRIQVQEEAPPATYELVRDQEHRFLMLNKKSGRMMGRAEIGKSAQLPGVTFVLAPSAAEHRKIEMEIRTLVGAAAGLTEVLTVRQVNREAKMVEVRYRDTDPELVWRTPNALVEEFIARRQEGKTAQARTTAGFLRKQLDTLTAQLATAEDAVREYRERHRVVSPETEASSQIHRLVETQSQRGLLEVERSALAQLLAGIEAQDSAREGDERSPYAQVLAFPTLLQNRAATELLQSLTAVQDQRRALLARRTPVDPDVLALTQRMTELEDQIRSMGQTYLEGLTNQVASLDVNLAKLNQELTRVPKTELQVARLERRPRVLEEIATMLQTRLKEAEIAAAEQDPSVRMVDAAIVPTDPISPKPIRNILAAAVLGVLLGMAAAFTREYLDKSVHSRKDVELATGVPVVGLIPRIGGKMSVIARERPVSSPRSTRRQIELPKPKPEPPKDSAPAVGRSGYTFLPVSAQVYSMPAGASDHSTGAPAVPSRPGIRWELAPEGNAAAEAYSILQTNVSFARTDVPVKVLLFTSPLPGDGKTTSAVNLALALAKRGLKTLLIDADIRRGRVHSIFKQRRDPGLTDVLATDVSFADALRCVELGDTFTLHYLTVGRPAGSPTALLESEGMRSLLEVARADYDTIIVDSSPVNIVTDASLLSALADGVLVVARAGVTEIGALEHGLEQLRRARAPVLGVVLNDVDFAKYVSYDSAYRYYVDHAEYLSTEA